MNYPGRNWRAAMLVAGAILTASSARAADFKAVVKDEKGRPVNEAVVYLMPVGREAPPVKKGVTAVMDQKNKQFVPHVLAVQAGTLVRFPNSDNILHQVYSFSEAKRFELPLYKGKQAPPVLFDKPGVVALGCNIHDWMEAYIVVLKTPYFDKTGKGGTAVIRNVPAGNYEAFVWHPDLKGAPEATRKQINPADGKRVSFTVALKRRARANRAPQPSGTMQY